MPANLPPDYHRAEERYRAAKATEDKIACLEEMLRIMPKHKGTDGLQAQLRARIAKLRKHPEKKGARASFGYNIAREGAGQVALVGPANTGKSSLVALLTNATPEVAAYPFTTREPGDTGYLQFVDVAPQLGWTADTNSRGVALADLNNDGTPDVIITHQFGPLFLYRNTLNDRAAPRPRWIGVELRGDGRSCNRDAAGSRVVVEYEERGKPVRQMREIMIASGLSAQNDRRALFGLGTHRGPLRVSVSSCGGPARTYGPFALDRYHRVEQGEGR